MAAELYEKNTELVDKNAKAFLKKIKSNIPKVEGIVLFLQNKKEKYMYMKYLTERFSEEDRIDSTIEKYTEIGINEKKNIFFIANKNKLKEVEERSAYLLVSKHSKTTNISGSVLFISKEENFSRQETNMLRILMEYFFQQLKLINMESVLLQKDKELDTVHKLDKIIDEAESRDELLKKVFRKMVKDLNAESGFVLLQNPQTNELETKQISSKIEKVFCKDDNKILNEVVNQCIETTDPVIVNLDKKHSKYRLKEAMVVSMRISNVLLGVVGVVNKKSGYFSKADAKLLDTIATQVDTVLLEQQRKHGIKKIFSKYVEQDIAKELLENPEKASVDGVRREVTVLFADMRGFTSAAEGIDSKILIKMLNEYLTALTEVVFKYGGTLDKYIGDEVMALFGAPIEYIDHVERSLKVAIEMQKKTKELNKKWKKIAKMPINTGIGIHTGDMIVGTVGCDQYMDYTVIGKNVNLAARLVSMARPGEIIVTKEILEQVDVKKLKYLDLGFVTLKGKHNPVNVFSIEKYKY